MKIFGALSRITQIGLQANLKNITLLPDSATTYTADRNIKLPPGDAASQLVGDTSTQTLTNKTISGSSNTLSNISLTASVTGTLPVASGGTNSATALNSNRMIISSAGAIVEQAAITASRALASDTNGLPVASSTTDTELGYVHGVTSALQTQLDGKASTALSNLTTTGLANHALLVGTSASAVQGLAVGTAGQVLTVVAGAPAWSTPSSEQQTAYKSDWAQLSHAVTISNASPGVLTWTAHGLVAGQALYLTTTGTLPTGLSPSTIYYVVAIDANTFSLAATYGGTALNTSSVGSGTHTANVTSINLTHSIGSSDILVQIYDKADGQYIQVDSMYNTDTNHLLLNASEIPSSSNWRVLLLAI